MSYQRIVMTQYGAPDVLTLVEEQSLPIPRPNEVRVQMIATSACFTDTLIRRGRYFGVKEKLPFSPGYDLVGQIDTVGEAVTDLRVGQRIAALTVTGAYAEYLCLPAEECVPVPDSLDPAEAVSMVLTYVTAYQMLNRLAKIERGQRILVHGASGAVGTALLQLGRTLGLEMFGTVSAANAETVRQLGAVPIDYRNDDFVVRIASLTPPGVNAVFDAIGGSNFARSYRCLQRSGTLVAYGTYRSAIGEEKGGFSSYMSLMLRNLLPDGKSAVIYNITGLKKQHPDWFRQDLSALFQLLKDGRIQPLIARRFKLAEAAEAHRLLEARGVAGKLVLLA